MRILVTGAESATGQCVARHLAQRGVEVRELASAAFADAAVLDDAMRDVQRVYHICPLSVADEVAAGEAVIAAARRAGVELFGYHSLLAPHIEEVPIRWAKLQVHMALMRCGLAFSIFQPASYMQNLLPWCAAGDLQLPHAASAAQSWVDLEDVGAAVAEVMTRPRQQGGIYELCGTAAPVSGTETAAILGDAIGRPIAVAECAPADLAARAGVPAARRDDLAAWYAFVGRYGFRAGNPRMLTRLLGRAPVDLAGFAAREMAG